MKISRIEAAGACDDCHRGARLLVEFHETAPRFMRQRGIEHEAREHRIQLCARCASYLATTLIARIDELRRGE